jgi:hypothetical protein
MSTEARTTAGTPRNETGAPTGVPLANPPPKRTGDAPPSPAPASATAEEPGPILSSGDGVTDTLADAADPSGDVQASRQMPEPDSLGG